MGNRRGAAIARAHIVSRGGTDALIRRMLERGGGLRGVELEQWYARLEQIQAERGVPKQTAPHIAEFRSLIDYYSFQKLRR